MASIVLSELSVPELDVVRRERHAAADAAFLSVTAGGREATAAERRRVDRLTHRWAATLDEYARRGLMIGP